MTPTKQKDPEKMQSRRVFDRPRHSLTPHMIAFPKAQPP